MITQTFSSLDIVPLFNTPYNLRRRKIILGLWENEGEFQQLGWLIRFESSFSSFLNLVYQKYIRLLDPAESSQPKIRSETPDPPVQSRPQQLHMAEREGLP